MIQLAPFVASSDGAVPPGMLLHAATNFSNVATSLASASRVTELSWNRARFARFEPATAGDVAGLSEPGAVAQQMLAEQRGIAEPVGDRGKG